MAKPAAILRRNITPMSLHKTTLNPSKTDKTHAIAIMIVDADKQSTVAPGHQDQ